MEVGDVLWSRMSACLRMSLDGCVQYEIALCFKITVLFWCSGGKFENKKGCEHDMTKCAISFQHLMCPFTSANLRHPDTHLDWSSGAVLVCF